MLHINLLKGIGGGRPVKVMGSLDDIIKRTYIVGFDESKFENPKKWKKHVKKLKKELAKNDFEVTYTGILGPELAHITVRYSGDNKPEVNVGYLRTLPYVKNVERDKKVGIPELDPRFKEWERKHSAKDQLKIGGAVTPSIYPTPKIPFYRRPAFKRWIGIATLTAFLGFAGLGVYKLTKYNTAKRNLKDASETYDSNKQILSNTKSDLDDISSKISQIQEQMRNLQAPETTYEVKAGDNAWNIDAALLENDTGVKPTNKEILQNLNECFLPANGKNPIDEDYDAELSFAMENWKQPFETNPNVLRPGDVLKTGCAQENQIKTYETQKKGLEGKIDALGAQEEKVKQDRNTAVSEMANLEENKARYEQQKQSNNPFGYFMNAAAFLIMFGGSRLIKPKTHTIMSRAPTITGTGGRDPMSIPEEPGEVPGDAGPTGGDKGPEAKASSIDGIVGNAPIREPSMMGRPEIYRFAADIAETYNNNRMDIIPEQLDCYGDAGVTKQQLVKELYSNREFADRKNSIFMSVRDIAKVSGMSNYSVNKLVRESGLKTRSELRKELREANIAQANEWYSTGTDMNTIAQALGITQRTAENYVRPHAPCYVPQPEVAQGDIGTSAGISQLPIFALPPQTKYMQ